MNSRILPVMLGLVIASAMPRPAAAASRATRGSALEAEARLAVRVSPAAGVVKAGELVERISRETGVGLLVQRDLESRMVVVAAAAQPARDLLLSLEVLFSAAWTRVGKRFVLVTDPAMAELQLKTWEELRRIANRYYRAAFSQLRPGDFERLLDGATLTENDLAPGARTALRYGARARLLSLSMQYGRPMDSISGTVAMYYNPFVHELTLYMSRPGREASHLGDYPLPR